MWYTPHVGHVHERRVPARDDERHERRRDVRVREDVGEDVPLEVVHAHERQPGREREPLRVREAHDERADEPGSVRDGDRVEVAEADAAPARAPRPTTATTASVCLRDAISGTTPPKRAWKSTWLATTLESSSRPPRMTAAAVSSQVVSIAEDEVVARAARGRARAERRERLGRRARASRSRASSPSAEARSPVHMMTASSPVSS